VSNRQGDVQLLVGAGFRLEPKFMLPTEFVRGSSLWAARVNPAESRRLEIVPRAIRLIVFIGVNIDPVLLGCL
jgi:hypothetical protein